MLVGWRRRLHAASFRAVETLSSPKPETPESRPSWFVLTPRAVESTLSTCSSDVIRLSFFLWCARQPQYFHGPQAFDVMVPVLDRLTQKFGSVPAIVRELEGVGCPRKAQTFLMLMRIYWRGGMNRLVLESFDEMGLHNYVPNTFARNIILDVLFRIGRIKRAFEFFRNTKSPNFLTFSIAICNLCRLKDWFSVRVVLRVMIERGFSPDVRTFSTVLVCLQNSGRVMETLQLVSFMIVSGKQLSASDWTILIDAFCRLGRVETASGTLETMAGCGISPSAVTYTPVIKSLFESHMSGKAFDLLDIMLSNGCKLDLVICNVLIDFFCKSRRYNDAIDLIVGLHEWNLKPDSYTLSSMMAILCAYGNIELIPKLIADLGISVDLVACNSLMNILCNSGFPSEAVEFYNDMVDWGFVPDNFSFAVLLNALCRTGRVDDAVKVYHGILMKGYIVDAHVHTVIINGLIKGGRPHRAIRLLRRAVYENFCLDAVSYTATIHSLFKGGMFEEACTLFHEMRQCGWVPSTYTYNVMLRGLFKAKKIGAAQKLLRDMADSGIEKDCISYNTIISYLLKLHQIRAALHVFIEMCDSGLQPSRMTYLLVCSGLCCAHVEQLEELYPRLRCYLEDSVLVDLEHFVLHDKPLPCFRIPVMLSLSNGTSVENLELEGNNEKLLVSRPLEK